MNQQACASSRFQFVEGSVAQVDRYCALLQARLGVERPTSSATGAPVPTDLRDEIDSLRGMESLYRVWGGCQGEGIVIRSEEPVDFHPDGRIVNVVPVRTLGDGVRYANVATQTVGVYPSARKAEVRDALAGAGSSGWWNSRTPGRSRPDCRTTASGRCSASSAGSMTRADALFT